MLHHATCPAKLASECTLCILHNVLMMVCVSEAEGRLLEGHLLCMLLLYAAYFVTKLWVNACTAVAVI